MQNTLKGTFKNTYNKTNKHGERITMYVYSVTGTPEELQQFEITQGEFYRVDSDGNPVWHSPRGYGQVVSLICAPATEKYPANVIADTSSVAMMKAMMELYKGTPVYDAMAQQIAAAAIATATAVHAPAAPAPAPAPEPAAAATTEEAPF